MNKRTKLIYWISTIWLALGMVSTAIVQLIQPAEEITKMAKLGYGQHVMTIVAIAKLLGVVALFVPKFPVLREWAYAGFVFLMSGALMSHILVGDPATEFIGPSLLLALTFTSRFTEKSMRVAGNKH